VYLFALDRLDAYEPRMITIEEFVSGTWLSRRTVVRVLAYLEQYDLLVKTEQFDSKLGQMANIYRLRRPGEPPCQFGTGVGIRGKSPAKTGDLPPETGSDDNGDGKLAQPYPYIQTVIPQTETETARACARGAPSPRKNTVAPRKNTVARYQDDDIEEVFLVWQSTQPGSRSRTMPRRKAISGGLARAAKDDVLDAVQGWRYDDWPGRRQRCDLEDCLRPRNLEQFRDWQRGINRPVAPSTKPMNGAVASAWARAQRDARQ
jgi:hypothetical protein